MTRINLQHPSTLHPRHLSGEFFELTRVFTLTQKLIDTRGIQGALAYIERKQPKQFTVRLDSNPKGGTGHVLFFYNKIGFLTKRYRSLKRELVRRGIKVDRKLYREKINFAKAIPKQFQKDWTPTKKEISLSRKRVKEMIPNK